MTRILVVTSSKHGSTTAIGDAIANELKRHRIEAIHADAKHAPPPEGFDAAILGSAVYMGKWMGPLKAYVEQHKATLNRIAVFLFSSGPLSLDAPKPGDTPADAVPITAAIGAREHVVFAGRLDFDDLNVLERAAARVVKAPFGDFRPWSEIGAWARHVAGEVAPKEAAMGS